MSDEADRARLAEAYFRTFNGAFGKIVLAHMEENFQNQSSFDKDPIQMAFNEGLRSCYLGIKEMIDDYLNLQEGAPQRIVETED